MDGLHAKSHQSDVLTTCGVTHWSIQPRYLDAELTEDPEDDEVPRFGRLRRRLRQRRVRQFGQAQGMLLTSYSVRQFFFIIIIFFENPCFLLHMTQRSLLLLLYMDWCYVCQHNRICMCSALSFNILAEYVHRSLDWLRHRWKCSGHRLSACQKKEKQWDWPSSTSECSHDNDVT